MHIAAYKARANTYTDNLRDSPSRPLLRNLLAKLIAPVDALPVDVFAVVVAMWAAPSRKLQMSLMPRWPITGGRQVRRVWQAPMLLLLLMVLPSPPRQMAVEMSVWMTRVTFW